MKKLVFTLLSAFTLLNAGAQTAFLEKTCYRGAFAPAPTPMWTNNWTEWDPQNKVYPAPTMTVNGNITSNTTWAAGQTVLLQGQVYVTNNSVLTIQPGVVIRGSLQVAGSGLFITTGSTLNAIGTVTAPIVFTSDAAPGSRAPGDWGGVILMGLASNNNPNGTNYIEGIATSSLTLYGGGTVTPNDNDNSGTLKYLRIEFGGYVYTANKEINGLTFGAVGRGTTIDYVQCSFINDDSFEWFGGTVNCKHLVAYRGVDDDFDTDNGWRGSVQFALGVRDPNLADPTYAAPSGASTSEAFESDNDPTGSTATPLTSGIFSNVTDIGPLRGVLSATTHPGFRRGARVRRNSSLKIVNSILMDHKTRALFIDGSASENNAAAGSLVFKNNILAGYGQKATETQTAITAFNGTINAWVVANGNDTLPTTANILTNPYNFLTPDYRPAPGSIALAGASFTDAAIAVATGSVASNNMVAGIPSTVCVGSFTTITPAIFTASSTLTPNYCSVSWVASSGVAISNSTAVSPSFTISSVGSFTITMLVNDANGNSSVVKTITTSTCTATSLNEKNTILGNVDLYPNPAAEITTLKIDAQSNVMINVSVTDITGKEVMMPVKNQLITNAENKITLSTKDLNSGIYFITLTSNVGKETVKLIVNK